MCLCRVASDADKCMNQTDLKINFVGFGDNILTENVVSLLVERSA